MTYSIQDIARIISAQSFIQAPNAVVRHLLIDSRSLPQGNPEEALFIAIKSTRNDGHLFIRELYERGVRNFLVSDGPPLREGNFLKVNDTVKALQQLAAFHRTRFKIPVIGITGSNGKTIVKEWLSNLLCHEKNIVKSPKSYNSQIGVPLSVWHMNESNDLGIFEAGISQPGEMENLAQIIKPTIGIITNIGAAHDAGFVNRKLKAEEKVLLFRNSEVLLYCKDYPEIDEAVKNLINPRNTKILSWSRHDKSADLEVFRIVKEGAITRLFATTNIPSEKYPAPRLNIPFTDDASIENAIHCWFLMMYYDYENSIINKRFSAIQPVAMRLEQKEGINRCTIINDSYNSDLGSLAIAIDFLNQQNQHPQKTLVLSDILQSGKEESKLYAEVAEMVNHKGIDRIIGIGKAISMHFTNFEIPEKKFFYDTHAFLDEINQFKFENEAILLKGARDFGFERINALLQKKSHETILEIHLHSIVHNLNFFRSRLKPHVKIMAMVKAFSYGSGSHEIANLLQYHRVDYLAVAYADEGVELRNAGITLPIMVMNPEPSGFEALIKYKLEPEIYSFRLLGQIISFLKKNAIKNSLPIHLKIDTGMHRLGFLPEEINDLISIITKERAVKVISVFSHLAASEEKIHDAFTQSQVEQFNKAARKITGAFPEGQKPMLHIANSSGALRFPESQLDMVRIGIGLYGVSPDQGIQQELQNVVVLKSSISQVKKIRAGESVGYSRSAVAEKEMLVAVVPVGYADGFGRELGNGKGKMKVKGKFASTVGNICMDMCMIDVTGLNVHEGDDVVVFGDEYSVSDIARDAGTIPYEILTGISRRVKRVYFQE